MDDALTELRDVDRLVPLPGLVSAFVVRSALSDDPRVRHIMDELQATYCQQRPDPEEQDRLTRDAAAKLAAFGYVADVDFTMLPAFRWMTPEEERTRIADLRAAQPSVSID